MRTLEDLCDWANSHNATCELNWKHQSNQNEHMDKRLEAQEKRLLVVEKKLLIVTSVAAALGSIVGSILQNLQLFAK